MKAGYYVLALGGDPDGDEWAEMWGDGPHKTKAAARKALTALVLQDFKNNAGHELYGIAAVTAIKCSVDVSVVKEVPPTGGA